jgi:hypothetical protein
MSRRQDRGEEMRRPYEIGFGKPPKSSQFKPGTSGNSRGRPKKTRPDSTSLNASIRNALTRERKVSGPGGVERKAIAIDIIAERFVGELANNPTRSLKAYVPYINALLAVETKVENDHAAGAAEVRAKLEDMAERIVARKEEEADREAEAILDAAAIVFAANQR